MPSAVDLAVAARIEAVRRRMARQRADRATRGRRRTYGVAQRHATKLARDRATTNPQETDPC
jgi:hypothetical protein